MRPSFTRALALASLMAFPASAAEQDSGYGHLDFSRMTEPQQAFFLARLNSLAVEAAVMTYCGETDTFEQKAKQGIRGCVTKPRSTRPTRPFAAR